MIIRTTNLITIFIIAVIAFFLGCGVKSTKKIVYPLPNSFSKIKIVAANALPVLSDDLDKDSLVTAIGYSLQYFKRFSDQDTFYWGKHRCTVKDMKETLLSFRNILESNEAQDIKEKRIKEGFEFYKSVGDDDRGRVLFTGYYEPVLEGCYKETGKYRYPLYRVPDNTNEVSRYSRADIDGKGILSGRNLEIIWLSDPVDRFFLHVQGSGKVKLPGGEVIQVGYAMSNGFPYRSIASYLIGSGKLLKNEQSQQAIKKYLRENPKEAQSVFNYNERYVFFRIMKTGPIGALGVPVTGDRSIASDPQIYPKGALVMITARKPLFNKNGTVISWQPFLRFVLNQDAGAAIIGPGRIDIFCGSGEGAEAVAGRLKETGEMYFIIKK